MAYRYMAYGADGQELRGLLHVDQEEDAEAILWDRGLTIISLRPVARPLEWARLFPTVLGPRRRDVIIFTQQLANLIESGVSILAALELLSLEVASRPLRSVVREVLEDVQIGQPLSAALERHEHVFPPVYTRMIEVGERTGNLGAVLRQLAGYMEREVSVTQRVRSAMTYPLFVLGLAFAVVAILVNFTLPPLLALYDEFQAELPWITRALLAAADAILAHQTVIFLGLISLILGGFLFSRHPWGKRQIDRFLLRIPIMGRLLLHGNVARVSRTLSTLLSAGLTLPDSMTLARRTVTNAILADAWEAVRQETLQGRGISEPLARLRLFPAMLAQVVRAGEETGTLDAQLLMLADYYEEEVDRSLKTLTTFLEPAMIIFVGVIVAFVAISVILPMYSLLGAIR